MKLTNYMRDDIRSQITNLKVQPLKAKWREIIRSESIKAVKDSLNSHKKDMDRLPDCFFPTIHGIRILYGKAQQDQIWCDLGEDIKVPEYLSTKQRLDISDDKERSEIFKKLSLEYQEIEKFANNLRHELNNLLQSATTDTKLFEMMPELKDFVDISKYDTKPLVVQTDKLRELLKQ